MIDSVRAHHALAMIRLLYNVARDAKEMDPSQRLALRRERSVAILGRFREWMVQEQESVLPKSPMGAALSYALNQWEALVRYTTDGDLAIDNNVAERAVRPIVVGRNNYQFFGSDTGGCTATNLYSLVASAKRHGLDPFIYLRDVLATIGATPVSQLDQFLPDRWKAQQLEKIAAG